MAKQMSDVFSKYGAPMGRRNVLELESDTVIKLQLFKVRVDSGGYDDGGAYWGYSNLYCARDSEGRVELYWRADSREEAKELTVDVLPCAKFYR